VSRLEALVARSAALCGLNEIVLLSLAIVVLCLATAWVAYDVGMIG
jgi:hypothetical protein